MSPRALAIGVAVFLIASAALALAPGAFATPAPAHATTAGPHPAVGGISVYALRGQYGYYTETTDFYTGSYGDAYYYALNVLYFYVQDTAGDKQVNITLTDQNYTRDGVGDPVWHVEVTLNTTTDSYSSGPNGISYTFPSDLTYGGWGWNLTASAPAAGNTTENLYIHTFYADIDTIPGDDQGVLPGETVTYSWWLTAYSNGGAYNDLSQISLDGWYTLSNGTVVNLFSSGIVNLTNPAAIGYHNFTVPDDASAYFDGSIEVAFWAHMIDNGVVTQNETTYTYWNVGTPAVEVVGFGEADTACPDYADEYTQTGIVENVCVITGAAYDDDGFTPVGNLPITIAWTNGGNHVSAGSGVPTTLTSNATGGAAFTFTPESPPFTQAAVAPFWNSMNLTVTDPVATAPNVTWTGWENWTFIVAGSSSDGVVQLQLNQLQYYLGQTVTATYSITATSAAVGTLQAVGWYAWAYDNNAFLAQGALPANQLNGSFVVGLPSGWSGSFYLEVLAVNATFYFYGEVYGLVQAPQVLLNPSSQYYTAGGTAYVTVSDWGGNLAGTTLTYLVYADYYDAGGLISSGTVSNGSAVSWTVPTGLSTPEDYYFYAALTGANGQTIATNYVVLTAATGYRVLLGVSTVSSYEDGSYQPGQTVTVDYSITPLNGESLPQVYQYSVWLGGAQVGAVHQGTGSSGSFQLTIPSDQPRGSLNISLEVYGALLQGGNCDDNYCVGSTSILVNPSPSFLALEVPAGSGITVGWLILLILIIVVAIVLVLLIRHGQRPPPPASTGVSTTTPMSPAAPPPSTAAPAEWKEPGPAPTSGGDSSPPPMPSPPPGAT